MHIKRIASIILLVGLLTLPSCSSKDSVDRNNKEVREASIDSVETEIVVEEEPQIKEILPADIKITKELTYEQYTLEDTYPYKDTTRTFQWDKIREIMAQIENVQREGPQPWGILKNRRNKNGEAPLVHNWSRNAYKNVADSFGIERFQGTPLFLPYDSVTPVRYGQDGELVKLTYSNDSSEFIGAQTIYVPGDFIIPRKYVHIIDTICFEHLVFVDRHNQNITTLEKNNDTWLVRSMNPSTTGKYRPPYAHDTPLGIFVIQEKKAKMYYYVDGTTTIAGYAPWASRFTNGGYIHGVPTTNPQGSIIEYSRTLGTIPRSHMCVRNASSHAKFVYDWALLEKSLVVVIE
ncbi:L,D-transpeptidase [Bacteroides sp. 224]|uniref:L,D-transpeptidase n=1 Tax=Bacteroides sp. 224 TaxID=2302936 RepID=UPI0013D7CCF9|nr:L,D-transpeptidase [Bacteroides sp. 224]NDV65989.1 murein L,D-transpeptidase [Bacteroides sp. 224]